MSKLDEVVSQDTFFHAKALIVLQLEYDIVAGLYGALIRLLFTSLLPASERGRGLHHLRLRVQILGREQVLEELFLGIDTSLQLVAIELTVSSQLGRILKLRRRLIQEE